PRRAETGEVRLEGSVWSGLCPLPWFRSCDTRPEMVSVTKDVLTTTTSINSPYHNADRDKSIPRGTQAHTHTQTQTHTHTHTQRYTPPHTHTQTDTHTHTGESFVCDCNLQIKKNSMTYKGMTR